MTFNPNAPTTFGVEWQVTRQGGTLLSASGDAAAAAFLSSSAQTVTALQAYLSRVVGAPALTAEVFATSALPAAVQSDVFRPNADDFVTNWTGSPTNTAGNLHTNIDEATLDLTDYVTTSTQTATQYQVNSAAAAPLARVLSVTVTAVVAAIGGNTDVDLGVEVSGNTYAERATVSASDGPTTLTATFTTNPATGLPWTQAQVQEFDTSASILYVFGRNVGSVDKATSIRLYQLFMTVESAAAPLATGTASPSGDGWATFTFASSWAKASGTDYTILVRKTNGDGMAVWNSLDSGAACPHASWTSRPVTTAKTVVSVLGDTDTPAHAVTLTVAGNPAADSQPYATLTAERVHSGRTVQQEFTPASTVTIGNIGAVIARQAATVDGDLTAVVKRRSNNAQVGGAITITGGDVADSVRQLRRHVAAMASTGSVTSGVQYYIELSSTATDGNGWVVAVASAAGAHGTATYGSTTDAATVAGVETTTTDAVATAAQVPAIITGVDATAAGSGSTARVAVSWTASVDAAFAYYEILRGGELIATETTKATVTFADYEARAGVLESYTVRQVLTDGRVSALAAADTVTLTQPDLSRLVSNHNPSINVELLLLAPLSRTRFEDRAEYEPLGADHVRVHRGSQDRGYALALDVEVEGDEYDGDSLFADLLAARDADVPYLTLVTAWGDRHFVTVEYGSDELALLLNYGKASLRARTVDPTPVVT